MFRTKIAAALALLATLSLAPAAMASVGGGAGGGATVGGIQSDAQVTRTFKMVITEIAEDGSVVLLDQDSERKHAILIDDKVKLRARSKKLFDGRRALNASDLAKGQTVRLVVNANSGRILAMTVLSLASA